MSETLQIIHMDDSQTEAAIGVEGAVSWHHTPTGLMVIHDDAGVSWTRWPWATVKSYTVLPDPEPPALDQATATAPDAWLRDPECRRVELCTKPGQVGGSVTVGESRIPVASVLGAIQHRGAVDAAVMYPLVDDDALSVLTTLAGDLDTWAAERVRRGDVPLATVNDPHRVQLCWVDDQNNGRVSVFPNRAPVHAMVARVLAGDDLGGVARDYDIPAHELAVLVRLAEELITNVDGPEHLGAPDRATYEQQGGF